jgi:hypothetical protein
MKKLLIAFIFLFVAFACSEDEKIMDDVAEYVSFSGNALVTLSEANDTEEGYPLTAQLWAFKEYPEDITINFLIEANNAVEGDDYIISPTNQVKIKAGKFLSDTIWIKTVNGDIGNELERTIDISLSSTSISGIRLGLGVTNPKNKVITFKINDDECSLNPICIFNQPLINNIGWDGGGNVYNATSAVDKINNTVTVGGNLIDYGKFPSASLTMTLTPDSPGAPTGTVTFGEREIGTDTDGYKYKVIQTGDGTYDAATGILSIGYDIYYWSGGWVYWYWVTNEFTVP